MRTTDYTIDDTIFRVTYGDITQIRADAIVSSDDNYLSMGGGVSMAILKAGGEVIRQDARKHVPLNLGDVVVTSAGDLAAKYIFHAVSINLDDRTYASRDSTRDATLRCLKLADALEVRHLAFPALGAGTAGFPYQLAAEIMTRTIAEYLSGETTLDLVTLTLYSRWGREDELNVFYERVTALASLATQTKRLNVLIVELQEVVGKMNKPGLAQRVSLLQTELEQAQSTLDEQPESLERLEQIRSESQMMEISRQVIETSAETQASVTWEDKQLDFKLLRTRLQGLQTRLNIHYGNLNEYQIEKAKYGGRDVPPRLRHAIQDVKKEIGELDEQVAEVKLQLAALGGGNAH